MLNALPAGLGLFVTGVWQRGEGVVGGADPGVDALELFDLAFDFDLLPPLLLAPFSFLMCAAARAGGLLCWDWASCDWDWVPLLEL